MLEEQERENYKYITKIKLSSMSISKTNEIQL